MWRIQVIHFSLIENSSPFFLVLKKSGSTVLVSGSFLRRLQTRNLSHPSPPVGVFPSQWVGRGIHNWWDNPPQKRWFKTRSENCHHSWWMFPRLHHLPAYPAGPWGWVYGKELSSFVFCTGTRSITNDAHGRKNGDHQSSKHGVPLLHYTTDGRAKYHECPSKNFLDPWFGVQTAVLDVPLNDSWGMPKQKRQVKNINMRPPAGYTQRWEWYSFWCCEITALHRHCHTIWE